MAKTFRKLLTVAAIAGAAIGGYLLYQKHKEHEDCWDDDDFDDDFEEEAAEREYINLEPDGAEETAEESEEDVSDEETETVSDTPEDGGKSDQEKTETE